MIPGLVIPGLVILDLMILDLVTPADRKPSCMA